MYRLAFGHPCQDDLAAYLSNLPDARRLALAAECRIDLASTLAASLQNATGSCRGEEPLSGRADSTTRLHVAIFLFGRDVWAPLVRLQRVRGMTTSGLTRDADLCRALLAQLEEGPAPGRILQEVWVPLTKERVDVVEVNGRLVAFELKSGSRITSIDSGPT